MRKRIVPGGAAGPQTRLGALCAPGWVRLPFSSAIYDAQGACHAFALCLAVTLSPVRRGLLDKD